MQGPTENHTEPALGPELLAEAEAYAATLVRLGFDSLEGMAETVSDYFYADGGTPVSPAAARRIVARLWRERLAEQETWPETTGYDRLAAAFGRLNASGVTARMSFTCCGRCGEAEIGAEAAPGDHGYVFFDHQAAEAVADGHGLWLNYGTLDEGADAGGTAAVGRAVVAALAEAGLAAEWDGDPARAISIDALDWRKRLAPLVAHVEH